MVTRVGTATSIAPSAARLTSSLRDIGYDFPSAIADLVDNSISADASQIDVVIEFDGPESRVFVIDNGWGMTENSLTDAFRFGSRRRYSVGDLGRYGLGLKTASLSQCRCVSVVSRRATNYRRIAQRTLDLDVIQRFDDWLIIDPGFTPEVERAHDWLSDDTGTVVIWENLDRVLPEKRPEGGWAKRRLTAVAEKTVEHLALVFHRFLENESTRERPLTITVNGEKVKPWNPFAPEEQKTSRLADLQFELLFDGATSKVQLKRFVLPSREKFSSQSEFDRLSGPLKWNRQQGLYIYRADRLVQWGGWGGVRAIDEHTKLARAAIDFGTELDDCFNINVAKMRVNLPPQLKQMLERPLNELCMRANEAYRKAPQRRQTDAPSLGDEPTSRAHSLPEVGLALRASAARIGEYKSFKRIAGALREDEPTAATALGL